MSGGCAAFARAPHMRGSSLAAAEPECRFARAGAVRLVAERNIGLAIPVGSDDWFRRPCALT
jgi:hypothetical protein